MDSEQFSSDLSTLLSTYPPPFIYIQDSESFRSTCQLVDSIISSIKQVPPSSPSSLFSSSSSSPSFILHSTRIDAVSTFTNRLLFESVINSLAGWSTNWEDGCSNWHDGDDGDLRWNENADTFIHGLRAVHGYLCKQHGITGNQNDSNVRLVIVIERAERLKETNPELVVPLTRLAEIARLDICVIFISQVGWENIRPSLGASPDPYYMDIPPPSKESVAKYLAESFTSLSQSHQNSHTQPPTSPYHPSLTLLYAQFITLLIDICFPFIHNPHELQYIAAARWPGFVKPVLDEYEQERADEDIDMVLDSEEDEQLHPKFILPSEDTRMRLNRLFNSSLTNALESLHPRLSNATDWALSNQPEPDLLSRPHAHSQQQHQPSPSSLVAVTGTNSLPRISKFILIASFLASTNPAKSDMRMFGRGLDEKKRKKRIRRVGGSGKKVKGDGTTAAAKVPQRLLGPVAFPLDRMIAILGALLEENDIDGRLIPRQFSIPGEFTDMEITRVGIFSAIMELTSMRLLFRTSPSDRLDGPPMFKCAVSHDVTLTLAKQLMIPLNDLLWDPM